MSKKILALLLTLVMLVSVMPMSVFAVEGGVSTQDDLNDAVAAAEAGDTVEITKAGTYKVPNLLKNITIKGVVDGVVFDCAGTGSMDGGYSFEGGKSGKLIVDENGLTYLNSSATVAAGYYNLGNILPVWHAKDANNDNDVAGYVFREITYIWREWTKDKNNNPKFRFNPESRINGDQEDTTTWKFEAREIFAANSGIKLIVGVNYTTGSGNTMECEYSINQTIVNSFVSGNPGNDCMFITFIGSAQINSAKVIVAATKCNFCIVGDNAPRV